MVTRSINCDEFNKLLEKHTFGWFCEENDLILDHCKICPLCKSRYAMKYIEKNRDISARSMLPPRFFQPFEVEEGNVWAQAAKEHQENIENLKQTNTHHSPAPIKEDVRDKLKRASIQGNLSDVKSLIANGADVNTIFWMDMTPLYLAAENGHLDIVEFLLANGADLNAKDDMLGRPVLSAVCFKGHAKVVAALLAKGANVNAKDNKGTTALREAAMNGHTEIVKVLLSAGAAVDAAALSSASTFGYHDIVELLRSKAR